MAKWLPYAVIAALLAAGWTFWPRATPPVGQSTALPPAPEVRHTERIIERPKIVYVYPAQTKQDLNLPAAVVGDAAKKVTATGKLDADERPYTLSAVLDTQTGESQVFARPDPLPWIGPGKRGAVGVAYGLTNGTPTGKVYGYHDLLQIKALHAGGRGEIDQRGEWRADLYAELRF